MVVGIQPLRTSYSDSFTGNKFVDARKDDVVVVVVFLCFFASMYSDGVGYY